MVSEAAVREKTLMGNKHLLTECQKKIEFVYLLIRPQVLLIYSTTVWFICMPIRGNQMKSCEQDGSFVLDAKCISVEEKKPESIFVVSSP